MSILDERKHLKKVISTKELGLRHWTEFKKNKKAKLYQGLKRINRFTVK